jgi:hypothetical protein
MSFLTQGALPTPVVNALLPWSGKTTTYVAHVRTDGRRVHKTLPRFCLCLLPEVLVILCEPWPIFCSDLFVRS